MAFPETAKYPGAVAGEADLLNHKNKVPSEASPKLSANIDTSETPFSVGSGEGARLPAANFVGSINDEIMLIASRSGDTLTPASGGRGFEGTTAASHTAGDKFEPRITAKAHNQLASEINALEKILLAVRSISASDTILGTDRLILATGGAGGITLTLPTANGLSAKDYIIKRVDAGAGMVTVDGNGGETIDGNTTWELASQHEFVVIVSDGTNWVVVASG